MDILTTGNGKATTSLKGNLLFSERREEMTQQEIDNFTVRHLLEVDDKDWTDECRREIAQLKAANAEVKTAE